MNQIYNDDFGATLRLVNATDALNLDTNAKATGPNGPCGAAPCFRVADRGDPSTPNDDLPGDLDFCSGLTLGQNRTVLGQLVGASNYDVGHIALGVDGGGVAYLGVIGGDYKGGGCTGLPEPKGDFFAVDYVAHEIGHQFGGDHTFNGTQWACSGGNRERTASVQPGSGSSVMAYAGICRQDNLQPHTDPYFSHHTIDQYTALATSAPYPNIEVQTVSLRGFDASGESIVLGFGANTASVAFDDYDAATVEAAVESVTGRDVSIAQWGFDEFGIDDTPEEPDPVGFQVIFNEAPTILGARDTDLDVGSLTVTSPSAGVSGFAGETAEGGRSFNGGSTVETTDNIAPVVAAPADKTIPMQTPFALTASGTDADGDPLTYLWEQNDRGGLTGTALVNNTKADGPLFRVFGVAADVTDEDTLKSPSPGINLADGNPTRVFPDMAQIRAGSTHAATGACPPVTAPWPAVATFAQRECFSEFLPTPGYVGTAGSTTPAMHFRVTARDGFVNGGGTAYDDITLTLAPGAGPFQVTSQATAGTLTGGAPASVTWAVKGTQPLAPNVRITLSTDGGRTFGTVLAASTPNDGTHVVTLPNVTAEAARIKVEAVDNYFFDVNDAPLRILADPNSPDASITTGPRNNGFELDRKVTFGYSSTEAGSSFVCTLDDAPVACGPGGVTVTVRPGTHTFTAAAVDASGNTDATPATRTWARPLDDRTLDRSGFGKERSKRAYQRTYVEADRAGATLTTKVKKAKKIALVVGTGKGFGKVEVWLGKKKLRTVDLAAKKTRFGVIVKVKTLKKPTSGVLRIRTVSGKTVRIDGLGVLRG